MLGHPFYHLVVFDANGSSQWSYVYNSNNKQFDDSLRTSIVRVKEDDEETYFIIRGVDGLGNPDGSQKVLTNVTKIDANGKMIWNKKYYNRNPGGDSVLRDYPSAAVWVANDDSTGTSGYCFIGGSKYDRGFARSREATLYYFGIDKDGNIVQYFTVVDVLGNPYNMDAIYDPASTYPIATTFSLGESKLSDPSPFNSNTQIGFIKLDRTLAPQVVNFYWTDSARQNEGVRICNTGSEFYVIGANTGLPSYGKSISHLLITKAGAPYYYLNYNTGNFSSLYGLLGFHDNSTNTDWIVKGGNTTAQVSGHDYNSRLICSYVNGLVCGYESLNVYNTTPPLYPAVSDYDVFDVDGSISELNIQPYYNDVEDDCMWGDPNTILPRY